MRIDDYSININRRLVIKPLKIRYCLFLFMSIFLSLYREGYAEEIARKVFVTEQLFYKLPTSMSQISLPNLMMNASQITEKTEALILTYRAALKLGPEQRNFLKSLLLGKTNHIIFTIGYNLKPDFMQKLLEIRANGQVMKPYGIETKILATGLYKIGTHPGSFLSIRISSTQKLPMPLVLEQASQKIDKILKKPAPKTPAWIPMHEDMESIIEPPYGKYNQSVQVKNLANDNRADHDFWLILMTNESIAGKAFTNSEYVTKTNDTKTSVNHEYQTILTYQPTGDLSSDTTVSFSIGTSGPAVAVSWNTGKTTLKNHSEMDKKYCRWEVNYNTGGDESKTTYAWKPGLEVRTKEQIPIIIDFENKLECQFEWQTRLHRIPPKSFLNEYTIKVNPY